MPNYKGRYRRRSSRSIRRSKKVPVILGICVIVVICIGLVVLAAALVGLKLKSEAAKHDDTPKVQHILPEIQLMGPSDDVPEVDAQIYTFNKSAADYVKRGDTDLSLMLRDIEGTLYYNSDVAQSVGWDMVYKSVDLTEKIDGIHKDGGYVCSYMYLSGFSDESNMAEMKKAYEKQLVIEAAMSGVDEILLFGLDVTEKNLRDVLVFLSNIKSKAGNCKIGIELDYSEVVSNDVGDYAAQMILQVCDFVSLDATSVPCYENREQLELDISEEEKDFYTAIEEIYYYMSGMQVRLTFSKDEAEMYRAVEKCTYVNRQIHE